MTVKKISTVFFSPTESTQAILSAATGKLPLTAESIDLTCYSQRERSCRFTAEDLVIFGAPVYGGRLPAPAVQRIRQMQGDRTPAILLVTYGNREYEDALLELKTLVEENGFVTLAAAAFVTEHSIMHSVAQGRPDAADQELLHRFFEQAWAKLQSATDTAALSALTIKGNFPYKEYGGVPFKPHTTKACVKCGLCAANCPVNAIPAAAPEQTDKDACISCMRCIKVCPAHARELNQLMLSVAEKAFAKKCSARKEPELFL